MENKITFAQSYKGGVFSGLIAAILSTAWNFIAQYGLDIQVSLISWVEITFYTLFFMLIGSSLYFICMRFFKRGKLIFTVIVLLYTLPSCYTLFNYDVFNINYGTFSNETLLPEGFPLLSIPMLLISGALALWGIPKFSK
jgi:hypothetical protein